MGMQKVQAMWYRYRNNCQVSIYDKSASLAMLINPTSENASFDCHCKVTASGFSFDSFLRRNDD